MQKTAQKSTKKSTAKSMQASKKKYTFKYVVVATGLESGMPGPEPDPGKGSLAATPTGRFARGYIVAQGIWNPNGLAVHTFDTERQADAWLASVEGKTLKDTYKHVLLAQLVDTVSA